MSSSLLQTGFFGFGCAATGPDLVFIEAAGAPRPPPPVGLAATPDLFSGTATLPRTGV